MSVRRQKNSRFIDVRGTIYIEKEKDPEKELLLLFRRIYLWLNHMLVYLPISK